jgi:hypothetical protein
MGVLVYLACLLGPVALAVFGTSMYDRYSAAGRANLARARELRAQQKDYEDTEQAALINPPRERLLTEHRLLDMEF